MESRHWVGRRPPEHLIGVHLVGACPRPSNNDQVVDSGDVAAGGTAVPPPRPSRPRQILVITAAAFGAVVIIVMSLFFTIEIIDGVTGCGSVDPTDPANYSTATLINDTATTIHIGDCRGTYCDPESLTLAPQQHTSINGACGVSGTDMTSWKVTDQNGRLVGYIAIDTPRSTDHLTFNASNPSRDRTTPTKPN
jgi:hypothetical protein